MRTTACRVALVLLYGGVAPIDPPADPCARAPLHAAPATEREWRVLTFDVEDLRVRRRSEDAWIEIRDARWRSDALLAASRPGWTASGRRMPADSLVLPWAEVERIEKPAGSQAGRGAAVGAGAGLLFGLGFAAVAEHDCVGYYCGVGYVVAPLVAMSVGAIAGALIGSTQHGWAPLFCASTPPAGDAPRPDESDE
jgi:hypothetical protein